MDKANHLAGNPAEWELLEDGIVEVLTVFLVGLVEDRRWGIGSLLSCIGRSGTLLGNSRSISKVKYHSNEGYRNWGASSISFETISVIWKALQSGL